MVLRRESSGIITISSKQENSIDRFLGARKDPVQLKSACDLTEHPKLEKEVPYGCGS